jgi:hypothetical protein
LVTLISLQCFSDALCKHWPLCPGSGGLTPIAATAVTILRRPKFEDALLHRSSVGVVTVHVSQIEE